MSGRGSGEGPACPQCDGGHLCHPHGRQQLQQLLQGNPGTVLVLTSKNLEITLADHCRRLTCLAVQGHTGTNNSVIPVIIFGAHRYLSLAV